jgi:hypothetical protein
MILIKDATLRRKIILPDTGNFPLCTVLNFQIRYLLPPNEKTNYHHQIYNSELVSQMTAKMITLAQFMREHSRTKGHLL